MLRDSRDFTSGRNTIISSSAVRFPATRGSCASFGAAFVDDGEASQFVAVNQRSLAGIVSTHCWTDGFPNPAFCIPIPTSALTQFIFGKSRMRKCVCTHLCGGRSVMVVPTGQQYHCAASLATSINLQS